MDEMIQLLTIFPALVWGKIFDEIKDPDNLEMLSNEFPYFRKLLLPKRVLFLFPKVWKILNLKYHCQESLPKSDQDDDQQDAEEEIIVDGISHKACPQCFKWTPKWWRFTTLQFRVVCQTWSSTIDSFLQTPATENAAICAKYFENISLKITDLENVDKFLLHFGATHPATSTRSPFFTRSVSYDARLEPFDDDVDDIEDYEEDLEELPVEIVRFLQKYGHHIWNLEICMMNYKTLQQFLGLVPNLRYLSIQYRDPLTEYIDIGEEIRLNSEIRLNPMANLQSLQVLHVKSLLKPIFNELVHRSNNILELNIYGFEDEVCDLGRIQSPNLEHLSMDVETEEKFLHLENIGMNWPMKKLFLKLWALKFQNLSRVFTILEGKWAETLTTLELQLPEKVGAMGNLRLQLHMITNLKLEMTNVTALDFILPLKGSLESLHLKITHRMKKELVKDVKFSVERNSETKFWSFSGELVKSNIWSVFSKLKSVEIEEVFCEGAGRSYENSSATKREWRKYMKEKKLM